LGLCASKVEFIPATVDELIQQLKARENTQEIKLLETEFGFDISNEASYNKVKDKISLVNVRRGPDNPVIGSFLSDVRFKANLNGCDASIIQYVKGYVAVLSKTGQVKRRQN